jgi:hypothetical protein
MKVGYRILRAKFSYIMHVLSGWLNPRQFTLAQKPEGCQLNLIQYFAEFLVNFKPLFPSI